MLKKIIILLFFFSANYTLISNNFLDSYNLNYSNFYNINNYCFDFAIGWETSEFYRKADFFKVSLGTVIEEDKASWEFSLMGMSNPVEHLEIELITENVETTFDGTFFNRGTKTEYVKSFFSTSFLTFSENKPFGMYHKWINFGAGIYFNKRKYNNGCLVRREIRDISLKFISMLSFKYGLSTLRPGSHLFRGLGSDANHTYFGHDIKSEFDIGLLYDSKISLSAVSSYHSIISDRLFRHCNLGLKFKWVFHTYKDNSNEDSDALQLYCTASRSFVFIEKNELISNNIDLGIKFFALFWRK